MTTARPVCRRCRQPRHRLLFPLRADPRAAEWATRHWCATCLHTSGHITTRAWERALAATEAEQARADLETRIATIAAKLVDQAATDPAVRAAVAEAHHRLTVAAA